MTKYLLAGAAAAALTLGAGFAAAQDFKVTLSGEAKFEAYFAGQKKDANTRTTDFRSRFRLDINPEAKGLNGALTYGAWVKLKNEDTGGNTSFENAYTYLSGSFGRVILGQVAPFNDDNGGVTKPQDFISENDGYLGYFNSSVDATRGTQLGDRRQTIAIMDQSTKARYDSPFISGLKIGVSYTPTGADSNWSFNRRDRSAATVAPGSRNTVRDAYEIGLLFDSTDKSIADKFGAAVFKASFGYQGATDGAALSGGVGYEDWSAIQAGIQVGYAGFTIGGHYVDLGKSGLYKNDAKKDSDYSYGIGAQYAFTPALLAGVGYTYSQKDAQLGTAGGTGIGVIKSSGVSAGVKYTVAKGLDVYADYGYVDSRNTNTGIKDSGNVFVLSTTLSF